MKYTLLHLSDLHAGWHFDLRVAEQLARQAHELRPDLVAISGDFVLRADFTSQWQAIVGYLTMLPQPQLVVPGNHDVSLFNGFYRMFFPLRRYHRYISDTLNPVFHRPGLTVVGGCTAHGWTIDGGYLYRKQVHAIDQAFDQTTPDGCRVLVLHHHVVDPPGSGSRRKIRNARAAVHLMERQRVDLFLCGHTHMSYIGALQPLWSDLHHQIIISQCGTSTSRRGRGLDRGKNSFHLIHIDEATIQITPYFYYSERGSFVPATEYTFQRYEPVATPGQPDPSRSR